MIMENSINMQLYQPEMIKMTYPGTLISLHHLAQQKRDSYLVLPSDIALATQPIPTLAILTDLHFPCLMVVLIDFR